MKKNETPKNVLETEVNVTSKPQIVEKEVEMGYFDDYVFDENNSEHNFHFQGSCARISYCSCNCHDCTLITSDARIKKDIKEDVPGLDFVLKLRPVTYHLDNEYVESLSASKNFRFKNDKLQTGFIAQEVEISAKKIGYDFNGIEKPENPNEYYGLHYSEFVVPLSKAVQELNAKNEVLQSTLERLTKKIDKLQNHITELSKVTS